MRVVIQASLDNGTIGNDATIEENSFTQLNQRVRQIAEKQGILIYGSNEIQGTKKYLLRQQDRDLTPLSEKIEAHILLLLRDINEISFRSIDRLVCLHFKGHLTPRRELIHTITRAYAEKSDQAEDLYHFPESESINARENDIREITGNIEDIGKRMDFIITRNDSITWSDSKTHEVLYEFIVTLTTDLSNTLLASSSHETAQHVLVYPGSRAPLVYQRIQQDFRLSEALRDNWHLVKFRHIRRLAERELITIDTWEDLIDRDPPMREAPAQLQII